MLAAYMVFSLALIIAVIMLAFQHACTFTAEIIVVLFIFWGGWTGLVYSTEAVISYQGFGSGMGVAVLAPTWIGFAFSSWFWLRLATVGEADFKPTPGGTTYFLFGRVSTRKKAASRFIVSVCFYLGFFIVGFFVPVVVWGIFDILRRLYRLLSQRDERSTQEDQAGNYEQNQTIRKRKKSPLQSYQKWFGCLSAVILVYSTLAIELTLVWNSVSDVYSVASTGQVIPLVAGMGLLINAVWNLYHHSRGEEDSKSDNNSYGLRDLEDGMNNKAPFQRDDATWR